MGKTNPNNVNQFTEPDPRQALFLEYYFDSKSDTFANALRSGIKSGYSEEYPKIMASRMPKWLSEKVKDTYLIR